MFLAITSCGSISVWAVWDKFPMLWALFIALSQFINAIKTYLPYKKRLKILYGFTNEIEALFLVAENRWFNVAEGRLTVEEVHKDHMDIKNKRQALIQKFMVDTILPHNEKFMINAKEQTATYFNNFYNFQE